MTHFHLKCYYFIPSVTFLSKMLQFLNVTFHGMLPFHPEFLVPSQMLLFHPAFCLSSGQKCYIIIHKHLSNFQSLRGKAFTFHKVFNTRLNMSTHWEAMGCLYYTQTLWYVCLTQLNQHRTTKLERLNLAQRFFLHFWRAYISTHIYPFCESVTTFLSFSLVRLTGQCSMI